MSLLSWLPASQDPSADLKAARSLADAEAKLAAAIRLSGFDRDFLITERIDKLATAALNAGAQGALTPVRLAVLASHTVEHLAPGIRVAGFNRKLALELHFTPYGLYRQSILGEDADLAAFDPQIILFALDGSTLPYDPPIGASETDMETAITRWIDDLKRLWRGARTKFACQVIQQTFLSDTPALFGNFEGLAPASSGFILDRTNAALRHAAREENVLILDIAWQMPASVDGIPVFDPVRWYHAKQLIHPALAPLYGDLVARVVAASVGLSRKCLVLDLDNTLWGGVIGDDGLEGIRLGQGDAEGEAFLAFQRYVARLGQRGVMLAVCSKNTAEIAEAAFAQHPEMALRRDEIACFVCNWDDKASNIRKIAKTLNIGIDSLVFVDDNPAERAIVRRELPDVAVPELPEDPAYYPQRVAAAGYFEAVSFTAEDAARGRAYAMNAQREAALEQSTDMEGYLKSLEMVMLVRPIDKADLARSSQLINKSNQFNLTTHRRTEAEVKALVSEARVVSLCVRLADHFGDNGLISVILARPDKAWRRDSLLIDTWVMSCRVLGRGVEAAALHVLAQRAEALGARALIGEYRPTAKNGLVKEHYSKLGFLPISPPEGAALDATFWRYELGGALPEHFIRITDAVHA